MAQKSPAVHVEKLIKEGFFQDGKTDLEVIGELKVRGFRYSRGSIAATLLRFVRKEVLRREKADGSYKYFSRN